MGRSLEWQQREKDEERKDDSLIMRNERES
jgi:hypothetical protein